MREPHRVYTNLLRHKDVSRRPFEYSGDTPREIAYLHRLARRYCLGIEEFESFEKSVERAKVQGAKKLIGYTTLDWICWTPNKLLRYFASNIKESPKHDVFQQARSFMID